MRTVLLLIAGFGLFLAACSSKKGGSHAPPPIDKKLLTGKWKSVSEVQFLMGYEFDADGTVKMKLLGLKDPIPGKYTWSGDRTLDLEYSKAEDVQKAYEGAAKAFKDGVKERIKKKELDGRAGPSILGAVADKLPDKQTYTVGLSDPNNLVLSQGGAMLNFEKTE